MLGTKKNRRRLAKESSLSKRMKKAYDTLQKLFKKNPALIKALSTQRAKIMEEHDKKLQELRDGKTDELDKLEVPYLKKRAKFLEEGKRSSVEGMDKIYRSRREEVIMDAGFAIDEWDLECMKKEIKLIKDNL